jgi:uncharacterized protein (DUF2252 family)
MNIVKQIQRHNAGRDPERLAMKYQRMRGDAFSFFRGTCHLFHARLPHQEAALRKAPAAWACGDLHLENFGSYKGDNRQVYFDINDFDEALLAPASWDLLRCLTSIWLWRASPGAQAADDAPALCQQLMTAYSQALGRGKAMWVERAIVEKPVSDLLAAVQARSRPAFLDSRTQLVGKQRCIRIDGRKALAASPAEQDLLRDFFKRFATTQPKPRFFEVLDVARRIAGTGSLGVPRFMVLVRGKGSPDANHLLDLKLALPSSLAGHVQLDQPAWADEAQRIVTLQQRLQAVAMAFLQPVSLGGQAFVLRGLQPSEDRLQLAGKRSTAAQVRHAITVMGQCLAWAQLRSSGRGGSATADGLVDWAQRNAWQRKLLALAAHCAEQARADWQTFALAMDDGVLQPDAGKAAATARP